MGGGNWDAKDWNSFKAHALFDDSGKVKRTENVFVNHALSEAFDPLKFGKREALDSTDHPNSVPIIIAQDVTGSMGSVVHACLSQLNKLVETGFDKVVIPDMQIAFCGIGDTYYDRAPVQMTQFESDIRIAKQLTDLYLEGGGGGNDFESYSAAWYLAAKKVVFDSYTKRKQKGYIFTIGDEGLNPELSMEHIRKFINPEETESYTSEQLFSLVSSYWNVYHIVIEEGSHVRSCGIDDVMSSFTSVIGQRVLRLNDVENLSEVILATLQLNKGMAKDDILKDWNGSTAVATISHALKTLHDPDQTSGLVAI